MDNDQNCLSLLNCTPNPNQQLFKLNIFEAIFLKSTWAPGSVFRSELVSGSQGGRVSRLPGLTVLVGFCRP